ncbi:MAG: hypothetical protein H8D23_04000 [Candidatus Brocadiales bacterium]|nr:hypothetical protein [Candidatus Brocadiales bacterium]
MEDKIISSIIRYSKDVSDLTLKERSDADQGSLDVASSISLLIATIHFLNAIDSGPKTRALIDVLVDELPRAMEDRQVSLIDAIPDKDVRAQAAGMINGAFHTNLLGGFTAIYNARVGKELELMQKLKNGPFGEVGAVAGVIGKAMLGEDKTPDMVALMDIVSKHLSNISSALEKNTSGSSSCFIATACFDSSNDDTVLYFRRFREAVLKRSTTGRYVVKQYYLISPPIAKFLKRHNILKTAFAYFLKAIAWFLNKFIYKDC